MLNVICLKHGHKYGPEYVNNLYNMIQRHLTLPHTFVCFTDDSAGLNENINIRILPRMNIHGWWWKPFIFQRGHFNTDDINLFFDLDMVIVRNIDHFVNYLPGKFIGLEDVGRVWGHRPPKLGSAVLRWQGDNYDNLWSMIEADPTITKRFQGDQDYIWNVCRQDIEFFPADWIRSYKWEIRKQEELVRQHGGYVFRDTANPKIPKSTAVLAFHGTPNPHEVQDPVIVDNWR